MGCPRSSAGKEYACNAGDLGLIPGLGGSPGERNGNPLQYSCLENSMDRGAWQATVHGVVRVRHDLMTKSPPPHESEMFTRKKSCWTGKIKLQDGQWHDCWIFQTSWPSSSFYSLCDLSRLFIIICLSLFSHTSTAVKHLSGFPGGSVVKNPPAKAGDDGSIPGSGKFPGERNGNPVPGSCLEKSMDRGAWGATVHGVAKTDMT